MIAPKVDLTQYDPEIRKLAARDEPKNAIVFYGSSTFTYWGHEQLAIDMCPLAVVNRGFGGSCAHEALYYYDKLIKPISPKVLVWYEGDNDLAHGYSPSEIMSITNQLFEKLRKDDTGVKFIILSVKKSIARKELWSKMDELNELYTEYEKNNMDTVLVDINLVELDEMGNPRKGIYIEDNLHFNKKGYRLLCELIKPVLLELE